MEIRTENRNNAFFGECEWNEKPKYEIKNDQIQIYWFDMRIVGNRNWSERTKWKLATNRT